MPSCPWGLDTSLLGHYNRQGQKLVKKKESDVGMLLTGIQSTEARCM